VFMNYLKPRNTWGILMRIGGLLFGALFVGHYADILLAAERKTEQQIDACGFLTDSEVAELAHATTEPGERHDDGALQSGEYAVPGTFSSTCLWKLSEAGAPDVSAPSFEGASYVILNVMQWPKGSGQARHFLESFRDAARRGEIAQTPVPLNIGDEGLWWGDGVAVCKADRSFGVSVHLAGDRDRERKIEEALARRVASRL